MCVLSVVLLVWKWKVRVEWAKRDDYHVTPWVHKSPERVKASSISLQQLDDDDDDGTYKKTSYTQ